MLIKNQHSNKMSDLLEKSSLLRKGKRFYQNQNNNNPKFSYLLKSIPSIEGGKNFYSTIKGNFNAAILCAV